MPRGPAKQQLTTRIKEFIQKHDTLKAELAKAEGEEDAKKS